MPRDEGFDVMDVSTSIANDTKFRRMKLHAPDHLAVSFMAYVATMAESWRAGKRVPVTDAWPLFLPADEAAVTAMQHVGLLDGQGLIPIHVWRSWFSPAKKRRDASRARWDRHNKNRRKSSTNDAAEAAS